MEGRVEFVDEHCGFIRVWGRTAFRHKYRLDWFFNKSSIIGDPVKAGDDVYFLIYEGEGGVQAVQIQLMKAGQPPSHVIRFRGVLPLEALPICTAGPFDRARAEVFPTTSR